MSKHAVNREGAAGFLRLVATVLLALWLLLGGGAAAATAATTGIGSAATQAPLLSITVQNTLAEVDSGDEVTYTAVLSNLGSATVEATVVLTVPGYVTVNVASPDAVVDGSEASWDVAVEAGGTAEFTADAVIGDIPEAERRVTTLVSVFVGDPAELIVRTADAAAIVGVEDLPNPVAEEAAQEAATADDRLWLTVGLVAAALLFVVLLTVTIVVVRSRRVPAGAIAAGGALAGPGHNSGADSTGQAQKRSLRKRGSRATR